MRKLLLSMMMGMMILLGCSRAQVEDTSLIDTLNQKNSSQIISNLSTLQKDFNLTNFTSCQNLDDVMTNRIISNSGSLGGYYGGYARGGINPALVDVSAVAKSEAIPAATAVASPVSDGAQSVGSNVPAVSYSQTNTQKDRVDEPEIIKTDGKNIYYYKQQDPSAIYIIAGPYQWKQIDLTAVTVLKKIKLPTSFNNIQLFLTRNKLIIIGSRYGNQTYSTSYIDHNTKTTVVVYDVTDPTSPVLQKIIDADGYSIDSRMVWGKLHMVTTMNFNRWSVFPLLQNSQISKSDLFKHTDFLPQIYETNSSSTPLSTLDTATAQPVSCNRISYLLPKDARNTQLSFSMMTTIDTENLTAPATTQVVLGNTSQIHVSPSSLYMVGSTWMSTTSNFASSCPPNAKCAMPLYYNPGVEYTIIHKFDLQSGSPIYRATNLVQWAALNQYSMDEDAQGNFRIITQTQSPQLATHVRNLDKQMKIAGVLLWIEPGEQFKSARFIDDKLYLVTFQQIDPLFVIDLASTTPRILWELKMPGYSTYLHPYASAQNGTQYIIGLWYDVDTTNGNLQTAALKLDLYQVQYPMLSGGQIRISQLHSKIIGGKGSYSESLDNPRMFVRDASKKILLLPIVRSSTSEVKQCQKDYYGSKYCYPTTVSNLIFAGYKWFTIDPALGIQQTFVKDLAPTYRDFFASNEARSIWGDVKPDQRMIVGLGNRVGYIQDTLYLINQWFISITHRPTSTSQTLMLK